MHKQIRDWQQWTKTICASKLRILHRTLQLWMNDGNARPTWNEQSNDSWRPYKDEIINDSSTLQLKHILDPHTIRRVPWVVCMEHSTQHKDRHACTLLRHFRIEARVTSLQIAAASPHMIPIKRFKRPDVWTRRDKLRHHKMLMIYCIATSFANMLAEHAFFHLWAHLLIPNQHVGTPKWTLKQIDINARTAFCNQHANFRTFHIVVPMKPIRQNTTWNVFKWLHQTNEMKSSAISHNLPWA